MTKQFEFESRTAPDVTYEVELSIQCRDRDGADATYDVGWLAVKGSDVALSETDLSPEDQVYLDRASQDLADENACDAWLDYETGRADAAYDAWKDDQMERGDS